VLTVVKVGGGLADAAGDGALTALCGAIADAGARHPLLVVPGGGAFADAVREHDRRFGLRAATAHRMAVHAMDQFGRLLADLIPGAAVCDELEAARRRAADGRAVVLLPAAVALGAEALPETWDVTSDTISAWIAGMLRPARLVLVKAVDGLFPDRAAQGGQPLEHVSVDELAALRAAGRAEAVDVELPAALAAAGVEAWVIGGREPRRLVALLEDGRAVGTRIGPASPSG
jgi:aspartokinase-like uncharacterized kinase